MARHDEIPYAMKGLATRDCFICMQLLQTDREYCGSLETSTSSISRLQMLIYMHKICVKYHYCEFKSLQAFNKMQVYVLSLYNKDFNMHHCVVVL